MKQKLLIAVNPNSGIKRNKRIADLACRYLNRSIYDYNLVTTQYAGQLIKYAQMAVEQQYDAIVVAGGDGSINEVSQVLVNTQVKLGIIPMGSGNGLARHLKVPLNPEKAFRVINEGHTEAIDTGKLNGRVFVSNTGMGFVSSVVDTFNLSKERGFLGYSINTAFNYFTYKSNSYVVTFNDNRQVEGRFFMINICNTNQFGYEALIAPAASITDGLLDVVIIKDAPFFKFPYLLVQMFTGSLKPNQNVLMFKASRINIDTLESGSIQVDGETLGKASQVCAEILPLSLNVIVPGHVK